MLKTCFLTLSALAACMSGFAAPSAQSSSAPVTAGIITSSSAYDQTNPDGSVTKMLMMVIKKPDGSSVIKTEALPTTITRDSQGRLVTSFTIPNEKMAVVDPLASAPTPSVPNKIDDLIAQRGPPLSVAKGARKAIYRWAELECVCAASGPIKGRADCRSPSGNRRVPPHDRSSFQGGFNSVQRPQGFSCYA